MKHIVSLLPKKKKNLSNQITQIKIIFKPPIKKPEVDKTFLKERKRNLRGYHLRPIGLPPPSSH